MIDRRPPTHILRVDVPLFIDNDPTGPPFDAFKDAIQLTLSLSRLAYAEVICDDPNVKLIERNDG